MIIEYLGLWGAEVFVKLLFQIESSFAVGILGKLESTRFRVKFSFGPQNSMAQTIYLKGK